MVQMSGLREACGVVGVWAPNEDVARLAYFGLYALQHRGQESAGIAASDGQQVRVAKDMGHVSDVFNAEVLAGVPGHIAIGHTRYSTTGNSHLSNAQPLLIDCAHGQIAIARFDWLFGVAIAIEAFELNRACGYFRGREF